MFALGDLESLLFELHHFGKRDNPEKTVIAKDDCECFFCAVFKVFRCA